METITDASPAVIDLMEKTTDASPAVIDLTQKPNEEVIRCIYSFDHNDINMICCDKCGGVVNYIPLLVLIHFCLLTYPYI